MRLGLGLELVRLAQVVLGGGVVELHCHDRLIQPPPYGGQYFHGCHMVKVSPPPSGQSGHTALCVS